ncbi:MAG: hypothetical protein EA401_11380 [Planctomycetota bacterium]|nr:MAG: hypothetical protein EA401_11380 [Planctomycetota bacterium]
MTLEQRRQQAAVWLHGIARQPERTQCPTVMGFDGFVDNIIDVVGRRQGPGSYTPLATIADFGARVTAAAGHSTNFELVVKQRKIGGNGPIMANALATLGHRLTYIGILGDQSVDPAFAPLVEKAEKVFSLGDPAQTDALEFEDGKLMLGKLDPLDQVSVARLREVVGDATLREIFAQASCVATVNWTMLLEMNALWDFLIKEIIPQSSSSRPLWFVDLADPAKRTEDDLRQALAGLQRLQEHVDVVLGLNEAETRQVLAVQGGRWGGDSEDVAAAQEACVSLRESLGLARVVCHMVRGAASASAAEAAGTEGFYEPKPLITTGAGDHFNAGYLWALAAGANEEVALLLGTATSGHYVRTACSPQASDLLNLLQSG